MTNLASLTVSESLSLSGWNTKKSIIFAEFRKKILPNRGELFFTESKTSAGNCLTFKHDVDQIKPGQGNGLKLALTVDQDSYHEHWMTQEVNDHNGLILSAGLKVYIYDNNQLQPQIDRAINVAPGFHTSIALKRKDYVLLPKPWGDCDEETLKTNLIGNLSRPYN